jgi:transposase InsO family protein
MEQLHLDENAGISVPSNRKNDGEAPNLVKENVDYIKAFNNRKRRHSHLGDINPLEFERQKTVG